MSHSAQKERLYPSCGLDAGSPTPCLYLDTLPSCHQHSFFPTTLYLMTYRCQAVYTCEGAATPFFTTLYDIGGALELINVDAFSHVILGTTLLCGLLRKDTRQLPIFFPTFLSGLYSRIPYPAGGRAAICDLLLDRGAGGQGSARCTAHALWIPCQVY